MTKKRRGGNNKKGGTESTVAAEASQAPTQPVVQQVPAPAAASTAPAASVWGARPTAAPAHTGTASVARPAENNAYPGLQQSAVAPPGFPGQQQFPGLGGPPLPAAAPERRSPPVQPAAVVQAPPCTAPTPAARRSPSPKMVPAGDALAQGIAQVSIQAGPLPVRPGVGRVGLPILLHSNFFKVDLPDKNVYHYDVTILSTDGKAGPEKDPSKRKPCPVKNLNHRVIAALQLDRNVSRHLNGAVLCYDGLKNIYTNVPLPFNSRELSVAIDDGGDNRVFVASLRFAAEISMFAILAHLEGKLIGENVQDAVQAADIILRTGPSLSCIPVGRSFFTAPPPGSNVDLGGGLQSWTGYYSSLRLGNWKPLLNVDLSCTAFYPAKPLIEYAMDYLETNNLVSIPTDKLRELLKKVLYGVKVQTKHGSKSRQYRINTLTAQGAGSLSFEREVNGVPRKTTVAQYMQSVHNIRLQFPSLPCIEDKKGCQVPMELCTILPNQPFRGKLSERQTAAMIKIAAVKPEDRFAAVRRSVAQLQQNTKNQCTAFNMKIDSTPLQIKARVLPAPKIGYRDNKASDVRDGVWRLNTFDTGATIKNWAVVTPDRNKQSSENMVQTLQRNAAKLGMTIERPQIFPDRGPAARFLGDIKNKMPSVDMTVVVLGNQANYSDIKSTAETSDLCMRTQCVKSFNVDRKMNDMFAENLLQKMNAKMGGINNRLAKEHRPAFFNYPFTVIGIDVTHASPGDSLTPSVAAVVGSMDSAPGQYYATTSVQQKSKDGNRVEYVVRLAEMVFEILKEFVNRNGRGPSKIVVFRDGVADTQLDCVRSFEMCAFREACLRLKDGYTPQITFVVVQKRHRAKFLPVDVKQRSGRAGNLPPGTIIDSGVVSPHHFDFYLCSHAGIQGTSKPAHYHVVHDDSQMSPDEMYRTCYFLCHTYFRCARSVSIPAPAYYAHLAAFRAREHLKTIRFNPGAEPSLDDFAKAQKVTERMKGMMYFV